MRHLILALTLVLLLPWPARADLITTGTWSRVATPSLHRPFWDNESWDGASMNVGSLLGADQNPLMEFLHGGYGDPVAFKFTAPVLNPTTMFHVTAWQSGSYRITNGLFSYDSGTGRFSDSWNHYDQYALFRIAGTTSTRYFLGIEDILCSEAANDRDYNDYVISFEVPTRAVPEPSALLLMTAAVAGSAGWRFAARRRKA